MKMRSVFFGLLLSAALSLQAQTPCRPDPGNLRRAEFHFERAETAYRDGLSNAAWKSLRIAKKTEPCFAKIYLLEAVLFEDEKKIDSAIKAYSQALTIDPDVFPNAYYSLAKLQSVSGRYAEADKNLDKFLSIPNISKSMREKAQMMQLRNKESLDLSATVVPFQPKNMGPNINTEYEEYLPFVTVDDQMMIFTRRYLRPTEPPTVEEDFFYSKRDSLGAWLPAVRMEEPINSDQNEGALFISPDGRYLFFAGCNRPDGRGSCDIYASIKRADGTWGRPFNLGQPINTSHWESQPCMSSDGRTLYFTSTRPGGFGKSDLWKSILMEGGIWSEPQNLGPNINTAEDENSPFLHPDGKTLYFASNGHGGMGGMDLFVSRMDENGHWSVPQNMGYPINTSADETTLSVNAKGDTAYFCSDNLGGFGKKDIYSFALYEQARPVTVSFMKGLVKDAKTDKTLAARFELISLKSGITRVASTTSSNGEFLVCLPVDEAFALNVSCPGYLFHSEHIALGHSHESKPVGKEILLQPIESGTRIVLENIFYQTNKFQLEKSSIGELERIYLFLKQNPKVRVEISGHTDNVGAAQYNKTLSENRAQEVAQYLINKGIEPARIEAKGYGFEKPVADNDSEEGRAKNRRTELKIL